VILEKDWKTVCDTIEKFYKNRELVVYTLNIENRCVDIGLYDSRTRNEKNERYYDSSHFRTTEIMNVQMKKKDLLQLKEELEKRGVLENKVYEVELNVPIFNIGDVVIYDNNNYGKIIDINPVEKDYPYAIVFPDIYSDNRPFWASTDEIKFAVDKEKIKEIDSWYFENKEKILGEINSPENEEEMEV